MIYSDVKVGTYISLFRLYLSAYVAPQHVQKAVRRRTPRNTWREEHHGRTASRQQEFVEQDVLPALKKSQTVIGEFISLAGCDWSEVVHLLRTDKWFRWVIPAFDAVRW